jgi:hypothetical protein
VIVRFVNIRVIVHHRWLSVLLILG